MNAGDPWQQGGIFVMAPSGQQLFTLREESPGFPRPDWPLFTNACRKLATLRSTHNKAPATNEQKQPAAAKDVHLGEDPVSV